MSDLPKGWESVPFPQICQLNPRKQADDYPDPEMFVTFVPMASVDATTGTITSPIERSYSEVSKGFTAFCENDVILAKITPCMENGKAAIARKLINGVGFGSTEFHVFRSNGSVLPEYIFYYIRQERFRKDAERNFTGSVGQRRVPLSFLEQSFLPVAPLNEQKRIVEKLEKLLGKVEAAQERLDKIPAILKRFRQSTLAAACSGKLTADWRQDKELNLEIDLPSEWKTEPVGNVIEDLKYGTSQKCGYEKKGVPVLRIPNISDWFIDSTDLKFADLPKKEFEKLKLVEGDVLLIRSNGSVSLVGKTAIIQKEEEGFAYAGYLIRLRPDRGKVFPRFLNYVLGSYDVRLQIEIPARSTSGVNNINSTEVESLQIPIPPLVEQKEIVRRVEELFKFADQIEERYKKARCYTDKLTQSILAKAFRGELVPQDDRDEPAAKLLERIKQNSPPEKPKRGMKKNS